MAPEEDDANFLTPQNFTKPRRDGNGSCREEHTELQNLLVHFNPRKVGFGILPWPGTEQSVQIDDAAKIAMDYLLNGKDRKSQGDKK